MNTVNTVELPPAMASLRPELGPLVARIESQVPYGAILLSAQRGLQILIDNRQEQINEHEPSVGSVLTAFDGTTVHEQAVGGFDPGAVDGAAKELLRAIPAGHAASGHAIDPGPQRQQDFYMGHDRTHKPLSLQDKLDRCRELHRRLRDHGDHDPRIVNAQVYYIEADERNVFHNRTADLAQHVERSRIRLGIVASGPNGVRTYGIVKHSALGWERFVFSDEEIQKMVDTTLALLTAERVEPGQYTIITAPGVSGTICHESFGHGVETDMFLKERAQAAHFIDKVVASPLVNIWDDPSQPNTWGSYFFDAEGMLARPTQIVENGVFRRGITDLYSATMLGVERSANGRRQDYTRKAYARMSNTYFGRGETPVADLFQQVEHGVYVEDWLSGMEDPKGWGIQVTCRYGHEIKHGRVTERIFGPIAISGYVPEVLGSISGVGDDWKLDSGLCGKGHKEIIPVADGGPHLLLKAELG